MSRVDKPILFVFFLCGLISSCDVLLAQENTADLIINRPQLEYKSAGLRDPFQTYIIKEEEINAREVQVAADSVQAESKFNELKVQGIIWGTKTPQAIINNKVYTVGDKIENAEILSIDKGGVGLGSAAGIFILAAPGQQENVLNI